jgi:hypothetical protein
MSKGDELQDRLVNFMVQLFQPITRKGAVLKVTMISFINSNCAVKN